MTMSFNRLLLWVIIPGLFFVGHLAIFTVDERELAVKLQLGRIVKTDYTPGIHWAIPMIEHIRKFDGRILSMDTEPERFLTSEKKNVKVDFFVKWRISQPAEFYRSTRGDERKAISRLSQIIKDGLRSEFGKRTIQEVVSDERTKIMDILTVNANKEATRMGMTIVDVRIKRIELPPEVSSSVYRRMEAERARVARDFRSRGAEAAERIRADADKQQEIIKANAYREAEGIRGEGDAKALEIYAKAFGQNTEYYDFYRSLAAYRKVFRTNGDFLVMEPSSEFFRYFPKETPPTP